MRAPQRQPGAGVIHRLLEEPYRFEFFQAVRLIALWLREQGIGGGIGEVVRFENAASLRFAPSEVEAIDVAGLDAAALAQALREGRARICIRPAFMGLLGACGALPLHYSELLAAHEHAHQDRAARAFFDMLANRPLALFYRARAKYRVRHRANATEADRYLPLLLAFAGVPTHLPPDRGDIEPEVLARFAAQFGARVVSAPVLGGVLAAYFQVPVSVEQFAGSWDVLAPDLQTRLGAGTCALGAGATAGRRIWRCDLGLRLRIGPVARRDFERFLPGGDGARALARLVAQFTTSVPHCEVHLLLRAADVQATLLDGQARLGLDSFVLSAREQRDRGDIRYRLAVQE